VHAAGVGLWDAWIRAGGGPVDQGLPLTLGADVSGVVVEIGPHVTCLKPGDEVFGVINARFTNGCQGVASRGVPSGRDVCHPGMLGRWPSGFWVRGAGARFSEVVRNLVRDSGIVGVHGGFALLWIQ
jgi:threonine dehydrogenase-like Zn-dependent dehydrogenase